MPFVDTQRYEMFDYMHPEIPEGGQRPEIPHKLITKEVLHELIGLIFFIFGFLDCCHTQ